MKAKVLLYLGMFILSAYLISCYPQKKILAYYPNGRIKDIRHYRHNDSCDERFVYYYDNGQKQYVRHWKGHTYSLYKMKTWYKSGAKRMRGSMQEKDTVSKYNPTDSTITFTGFFKANYKEWYENGKLKFETVNKNGLLFYYHYNEQGVLTRKEFICGVRPDGYDTVCLKIVLEPNGKRYVVNKTAHHNYSGGLLIGGDD